MRTTTLFELRRTLDATLDGVSADREPVLVTRDDGEPAAVLVPVDVFSSMEETAHLLRSPRNAERLVASIQALDGGLGSERVIPK